MDNIQEFSRAVHQNLDETIHAASSTTPMDDSLAEQFSDALRKGHVSKARAILANGSFDPNALDGTAIFLAIELGYLDLVEQILSRGADPELSDPKGRTPLFFALENEYFDVAEMLLLSGAEISARDENGWTPLIWASIKGYPRVVDFLIKHGADIHICNNDGWNAITGAFFKQHKSIVDLLIDNGAKFGRKYKEAALLSAFDYGAYDVVRFLIKEGVNVNIGSSDGQPLLISVLHRGDEDVLKLLLEAGADTNVRDKEGNPALLSSILAAQYKLAETLVRHGVSVNVKGPNWTALHISADRGQLELCRSLIEAGASIDQLGASGKTALILASKQEHLQIVTLLLENGANPNLKDSNGKKSRSHVELRIGETNVVYDLLSDWENRS